MATKCESDSEYSNALQKAKGKPILIDFFATWCGPCKMIEPELEKLATQYSKTIAFIKVDVEHCKAAVQQFGIRAMPTFVALSPDQKEYKRTQGADVAVLKEMCAELSKKFPGFETFSGKAHTLSDNSGPKKDVVDLSSMADLVENISLKTDEKEKEKESVTVQLVISAGEKKTIKMPASVTILQLYGHVKYLTMKNNPQEKPFQLLAGFPQPLLEPNLTVKEAEVNGVRITIKWI